MPTLLLLLLLMVLLSMVITSAITSIAGALMVEATIADLTIARGAIRVVIVRMHIVFKGMRSLITNSNLKSLIGTQELKTSHSSHGFTS